jgi:hypothetical protein
VRGGAGRHAHGAYSVHRSYRPPLRVRQRRGGVRAGAASCWLEGARTRSAVPWEQQSTRLLAARSSAAQPTVVSPLMTRWDTCTLTHSASVGSPNLQCAGVRVGVRTATARANRTALAPRHLPNGTPHGVGYPLLAVLASSMYLSVPRRLRLPFHTFHLIFSTETRSPNAQNIWCGARRWMRWRTALTRRYTLSCCRRCTPLTPPPAEMTAPRLSRLACTSARATLKFVRFGGPMLQQCHCQGNSSSFTQHNQTSLTEDCVGTGGALGGMMTGDDGAQSSALRVRQMRQGSFGRGCTCQRTQCRWSPPG